MYKRPPWRLEINAPMFYTGILMNDPALINDPSLSGSERLEALKRFLESGEGRRLESAKISGKGEINNHIHTIYSFSPYTPAMAALKARQAGLEAAGSVDHDSVGAAQELVAACALIGMGGCSGLEIRVSMAPFAGRKINNPDSQGIAYVTIQGIPAQALEKTSAFLEPIRAARLSRSREMTKTASLLLKEAGLEEIDFKTEVEDASQYANGGEITERHLMAAASAKLIKKFGRGSGLCEGLKKHFGIDAPEKLRKNLSDPENPHYLYDLLGLLKTGFLPRFFIQPGEHEIISAEKAVSFALSIGAIPVYSYLGDVGESPTGDKKAEKFEDDYLDDLLDYVKKTGFKALTYMPPRNTASQLERIQRCCREYGFMEISGVDINSSRQSFNCPEVLAENSRHLVDTTWALIAHERIASCDPALGLFQAENPLAGESLSRRLELYAKAGKSLDLKHPDASIPEIIETLRKGRNC